MEKNTDYFSHYDNNISVKLLKFLLEIGIFKEKDLDKLINEFSKINFEDFYFLTNNCRVDKDPISKLKYKLKLRKIKNSHKFLELAKLAKDSDCYSEFEYLLYSFRKNNNQENLKLIYKYLNNDPISKEELLEKMNRLLELEIKSFDYNPKNNLNGRYEGIIIEEDDDTKYIIEWIYSDGNREYYASLLNNHYSFELNNAKYIIKKEDSLLRKRPTISSMIISDLNFDINSLPTKEEVYSRTISPISKETKKEIIKKTKAVNNIYNIETSSQKLKEDLENLRKILKNIPKADNAPITLASINSSLSLAEDIPEYLSYLTQQLNEYYNNTQVMSQEVSKKNLVRKKEYERQNKQYTDYE